MNWLIVIRIALRALYRNKGRSLLTALGTTLAEFAVLLKLEVEMTLVLLDLHGFDIDDPKERQLGFLLASVGTYAASTGSNFLVDVARVEGEAIWNYAPRKAGKFLIEVMAILAGMYLWRGVIRLLPVIGIVAGTALNKVLTSRVGDRVSADLRTRVELLRKPKRAGQDKATRRKGPGRSRARPTAAGRKARGA